MVEAAALGRRRRGLARPASSGPRPTARRRSSSASPARPSTVPVTVSGATTRVRVDFVHDVTPVLSKLGCNAGTCHGSAQGKNGFKLSLRGYDPIFDVRALTDDLASRRVNLASPDDSLMLLKPTGAVPHVGGQVMQAGRAVLRDPPRLDRRRREARPATPPQVTKIEVCPTNPVVQQIGAQAADPRARHLRRRQGPRRDPRGVHRERQHRGRHGRTRRA